MMANYLNFNITRIFYLNLILIAQFICILAKYEVIYAVNAGGDYHVDKNGIRYQKDPLKIGTESDYGKNLLMISRVPQNDVYLYQTERYHTGTFGYDLPITGDGEYLLLLKFCEVYFNDANMKVFDVNLNEHNIIADLDIYQNVGKGAGYDVSIYFTIKHNTIYYNDEESTVRGNKIRLEFIKGSKDNPKINAFALLKGDINDLQKLQPLNLEDDDLQSQVGGIDTDTQINEDDFIEKPTKTRKTSGPKQPNPYAMDESSIGQFIPIFVAIGAFIPLLFCVCKL